MIASEFLKTLLIIWGISAIVIFMLQRLKVSPVVGFLIAGIIMGPNGAKLARNSEVVEVMAEIGVILLLFTIGIELSMRELIRLKKQLLIGGSTQVIFTIALSSLLSYLLIRDINKSVFLGFLISLSSTAIVLKILADKGEIDSPHGRVMTSILIFQDLCVVPMMLFVPFLAGSKVDVKGIGIQVLKAVLIIGAVLFMARWIIPKLFYRLARTGSRELFIISLVLLCFGVAYLTSLLGLSLALGAFLAGLIISESEYSHQATSDILPFKGSFTGLFFVSVGMILNINNAIKNIWIVIVIFLSIFLLKSSICMVSACLAGMHIKPSIQAGIGLSQVGEFSFVLALTGKALGIIDDNFYQFFISSSILTMIATPFLIDLSPKVAYWLIGKGLIRERADRSKINGKIEVGDEVKSEHVIIVGFGLVGKNLALVLKQANIPYVVIELNIDTVIEMKESGEPIYYGDGTSKEILNKAGVRKAKLIVIAISDPVATRRIVSVAYSVNKNIYIVVRTRYLAEVEELKRLGASDVIPEEYETSIEIFSRVLGVYHFPNHIILDIVEKVRSSNYLALRGTNLPKKYLKENLDLLPDIEVDSFILSNQMHILGKSLGELHIREETNATILAVKRKEKVIINPPPSFKFCKGDIIIYAGDHSSINKALVYFKGIDLLEKDE